MTTPDIVDATVLRDDGGPPVGPQRATLRFMRQHPAHWIALGFGSGLAPMAPGTVGTLWAWAVFAMLDPWLGSLAWGLLILASLLIGIWACSRTAHNLGIADPGAIVWDEVVAFWLVLWLVMPAGLAMQIVAFALFRWFDAAKPGPVGWADRLFHGVDVAADPMAWNKTGLGIMLDDLVAAFCTLLVIAAWRWW